MIINKHINDNNDNNGLLAGSTASKAAAAWQPSRRPSIVDYVLVSII